MLTGPLFRVLAIASLSISLIGATACASGERLVGVGITPSEDAPSWVTEGAGRVDADGQYVFVGRGLGHNVLDEKGAYNAARDHAMAQLAHTVATEVETRTGYVDQRRGPGFIPRRQDVDTDGVRSIDQAMLSTDALARNLREQGLYWERWSVRRSGTRYKCWVLMTIDAQEVEQLVQKNLARLEERDRDFDPTTAERPYRAFDVVPR